VSGGNPQINIGEKVTATQQNAPPKEFLEVLETLKDAIFASRFISEAEKQEHVNAVSEMRKDIAKGKSTKRLKKLGKGLLSALRLVPDIVKAVVAIEPFISHLR
jgi:ribosomal protein L29